MNTEEAQYIREAYNKLPKELQEELLSGNMEETVHSIGSKYSVALPDISEVVDEVELVMLGVIPIKDLSDGIEMRLGVEREEAVAIAQEIENKVLNKFKATLEGIEKMEDKKDTSVLSPLQKIGGGDEAQIEEVLTQTPSTPPTPSPIQGKPNHAFEAKLHSATIKSPITPPVKSPTKTTPEPQKTTAPIPVTVAVPEQQRIDPYREQPIA